MTPKDKPAADRIAPTKSNLGFGPRTPASTMLAAQERDAGDHDRLEQEGEPPAGGGGDQATDERASGGTDPARGADGAERLGAGGHVTEEDRREDVDGRDQQRGPDALQE